MLLYKNHRFHCEGVSFAIPDGLYLDTSYEEVPEDTIHLWSEDEQLYVRIGIQRETKGAFEELAFVLRELEEITVIDPPKPILMGGLSGYVATYISEPKEWWELHLDISGTGNDRKELLLLIRSAGKLPEEKEMNKLLQMIGAQKES